MSEPIHFGREFLTDLEHKMWVVHDEPELLEDYGLKLEQVAEFVKSIQRCEGGNLIVPPHMAHCVNGEMENMAEIIASNQSTDGNKVFLQAAAIRKQLKEIALNAPKANPAPDARRGDPPWIAGRVEKIHSILSLKNSAKR